MVHGLLRANLAACSAVEDLGLRNGFQLRVLAMRGFSFRILRGEGLGGSSD